MSCSNSGNDISSEALISYAVFCLKKKMRILHTGNVHPMIGRRVCNTRDVTYSQDAEVTESVRTEVGAGINVLLFTRNLAISAMALNESWGLGTGAIRGA